MNSTETTHAPVHVIVDDRERNAGVIEALQSLPEVVVEIKRLTVGDYVVDDRCLIERKTLLDFAASVIDGRLFSEALKLGTVPMPSALILEGRASDLAGSDIRREALQGAMVSLSVIFRLPVLRSLDPAETAKLLLYAGQQLWRQSQDLGYRSGRRPKNKRRRLYILQSLPGIGPSRAAQLLEKFGNLEAIMAANADRLAEVEGIGEKTAAAIREVLSESPLPYGVKLPIIEDF